MTNKAGTPAPGPLAKASGTLPTTADIGPMLAMTKKAMAATPRELARND